jgi:Lon protease-like protein
MEAPAAPPPLSQLPLFPLRSVLFPGGYLPLRIFEVRYLDMIGRSHRAGTPFGVVCLTEGAEVSRAPVPGAPPGDGYANEAFHLEGTLATITRLERPNPGLMMVRCTGAQRFRVRSSEKLKHGLWMADVELLPDDVAVPVPPDLENAVFALQELVRGLSARTGDTDLMPLQPPYQWGDCGWLANRWCELLPLDPQQKQRLMSLDNPLLRLELVADLLEQMGLGLPLPDAS